MNRTGKTPPAEHLSALLILLIGVLAGTVLLSRIEKIGMALQAWVLSEPDGTAFRFGILFFGLFLLLSIPVLGFACYLWRIGDKAIHAHVFPPPGQAFSRHVVVISGPKAVLRGRVIKCLAVSVGVAAFLIGYFFWSMATFLCWTDN